MKAITRVLPFFLLAFFVGCGEQVLEPDSSAAFDSPQLKQGGGGKPGGGKPGGGSGTPADPAIAYEEGWNLKVMNEDGSNQMIVYTSDSSPISIGGRPSWSPDGTRLAVRGPYPEPLLVVVDLTLDSNGIPVGSTPTQITTEQVFDPAWSPTSDLIAYAGLVDGENRYLMTVSANGGPSTIVYQTPTANCHPWGPTWNPEGDKIAFHTHCDSASGSGDLSESIQILTLADAPTQSAQSLVPEGMFSGIAFPDWSRDSTRIVFGGRATSSSDYAVYIVDVASGDTTSMGLTSPYGYPGAPYSWSPDDSKLVVDLDRAVRLVDADPASTTYGQVIPKRKSKLASGGHPNWRRCVTGATGCGLH